MQNFGRAQKFGYKRKKCFVPNSEWGPLFVAKTTMENVHDGQL